MERVYSIEFMGEALTVKSILEKHPDVKRVLDVGCGTGMLGYLLKPLGYEFVGVDIDCSQALIPCVECDVREGLPFKDKSFDAVVSQHVIEHFYEDEQRFLVKEMVRVARKLVVVITPNRRFKWKKEYMDGTYHPDHKRMLSREELHELLKPYGRVTVFEINNFVYASSRYFDWVAQLHRVLPKPTLVGVIEL